MHIKMFKELDLTSSQIISYSSRENRVQIQSHLTNRLLMRRYALVQQARDADVFGILVGTLGVGMSSLYYSHLRSLMV